MAIYWHPYLAQFLRQDYGSLLTIEDEVNLGEMPLRLDLLLIPRYPVVELPYPFCHLGQRTLASYKGPGDTAGQPSLVQLLTYALLYQQREGIWKRSDLTLWLLANEFADDISLPSGANIADMQEIGVGMRGGTLDGFPVFLIDLGELPVNIATLPLVMAAKGANEQALIEFLLDNHEEYASYIGYLIFLHIDMFMEVLTMRQMTAEELGLDMESVLSFLRFYDDDKVVESILRFLRLYDDDKVMESVSKLYGDEQLLKELARKMGEELAVKGLMRTVGKERLRQIIEQLMTEEPDNNDE
ncbi:hypothetical protein H8E77_25580 [bacterium]|nr:hypothetical protein [bacterium]